MKEKEIERLFNKALCERYPFLIPRNVWTDSIVEDYNYEFTELDGMPDGWRKAFGIQFMEELRENLISNNFLDKLRILQIKEKYGVLRFYISGAPEELYDIIHKYEELSSHYCYRCGAPGKLECWDGWFITWCEDCKEKIINRNV